MAARRKSVILLGVIILIVMVVLGCEGSTTAWPTVVSVPPDETTQALTLERYATESAAEVITIQAHQATATALAENYYATVNADQALQEQQRLADAHQATAIAAQAQVEVDATIATATALAYEATATQQAYEWEATAIAQRATATQQAYEWEATAIAQRATATQQAREWEATAIAQRATATAQEAVAVAATATRLAWEGEATATAESILAAQAEYQAEAIRKAQQEKKTLAAWRNYGIPGALLVLLGCIVLLAVYAVRQYARRTSVYQAENLQDDTGPQEAESEDAGETPAQLVPILPPTPSAPGLRSVRILRGLDQARRAGFLSGPLLDSLEASWRQIRRKDDERDNTD